jgi:hypothetical protein
MHVHSSNQLNVNRDSIYMDFSIHFLPGFLKLIFYTFLCHGSLSRVRILKNTCLYFERLCMCISMICMPPQVL